LVDAFASYHGASDARLKIISAVSRGISMTHRFPFQLRGDQRGLIFYGGEWQDEAGIALSYN